MTLHCDEFERALVSDEPAERTAARRHAIQCPDCRALLAADELLAAKVAEWKAAPHPAPPPQLKTRIAAAIAEDRGAGRVPLFPRAFWVWAAAAMVLLALGAMMVVFWSVHDGEEEMIAAIHRLDNLQQQYARAIAQLELEAEPILDQARNHELDAQQASMLMSYRDRLTHLDGVIAEVKGFLAQQPGHSGAHKVLLAAYREKDDLLRKILHNPEDQDGKQKHL